MKVTDAGLTRIRELNVDDQKLRVAIIGGGCGGLTYSISFVDHINFDDIVIDVGDQVIIIDAFSNSMLENASLDFVDSISERRLTITGLELCQCGCSFSD